MKSGLVRSPVQTSPSFFFHVGAKIRAMTDWYPARAGAIANIVHLEGMPGNYMRWCDGKIHSTTFRHTRPARSGRQTATTSRSASNAEKGAGLVCLTCQLKAETQWPSRRGTLPPGYRQRTPRK